MQMPRKKKTAVGRTETEGRRRPRRHVTNESRIPEVYQDMLLEAAATPTLLEERATKRRRVEGLRPHAATPEPERSSIENPENYLAAEADVVPAINGQQTIYDDFPDSDESEADFEDVDLEAEAGPSDGEAEEKQPLQLDLSGSPGRLDGPTARRRKPATTAEKRLRLDVHKWHLLCLVLHGYHRNRWCDDEEVQAILKPLINRKLIKLLHLDDSKPQYARNHSFNQAMEEIIDLWRREWTNTAKGIRRAFWTEDVDVLRDIDDLEDPVDVSDFKEAAKTKSGSRDLGAQLFCALLRSVAVETRLVFSLQPLPFSGVAKGVTPEKATPQYIYASSSAYPTPHHTSPSTRGTASPSNPRWRASEFASEVEFPRPVKIPPRSHKRIKDSPYPIFWVEVFSPSIDKWIPVDPLVRRTFNKPRTGYEPPISDRLNSMSYVVAFEDDASARDVTRRYSGQYNAKTRKLRIESTKGGEKWWRQTMAFFARPFPETRDEIEDNELAAREAQEGMPKSVGDFKGHPIFALGRHLRRNEIIYPLREAGKISSGAGAKVEPVYRRKDVHTVRSADQWYRRGRDVKEGEQPLKRAVNRRSPTKTPPDEGEMNQDGTGLYAEFQTDLYVPPPVVDGKIPRNAYGNLDVYVSSMIPAGAIHLRHPVAARAANELDVDYANAITGFHFRGRQGTAIINGIVVAEEYREALVDIIKWMELEQVEAEQEKRSNLALQMWKRFLTALRIREKINKDYADTRSDEDMTDPTYDETESGDDIDGGGFLPDHDTNEAATLSGATQSAIESTPLTFAPSEIIVVASPHKLKKPGFEALDQRIESPDSLFGGPGSQEEGGGFLVADGNDEGPGGFIPEDDVNDEGGGFIPYEEEDGRGGGVIPDEAQNGQGRGIVSDGHSDKLEPVPGQAVDVVTNIRSTTAPTSQASGGSASPPVGLDWPAEEVLVDKLHTPSASDRPTFVVSVKDVEPRRSPDSIDNQSLLSQDPEDEDAEPEWLVDDEER